MKTAAEASAQTPHALTRMVALLLLLQSTLGLCLSEQYRDPAWIQATWFGNDWVTLVIAAPLLLTASELARRGSLRARLVWLGVLGYCTYNYAFYLFGAALNAFFPIYVTAFVGSVITLILAVARTDGAPLPVAFRHQAPRRVLSVFLFLVGIGLAGAWLSMWGAYAFAGKPTPVEPEAFRLIAALDLSIMAPTFVAAGITLWRRASWSHVLGGIACVQGALYLLVLALSSLVAVERGLVPAPGEVRVWVSLAVVMSAATVLFLSTMRSGRE